MNKVELEKTIVILNQKVDELSDKNESLRDEISSLKKSIYGFKDYLMDEINKIGSRR